MHPPPALRTVIRVPRRHALRGARLLRQPEQVSTKSTEVAVDGPGRDAPSS